MNELQLNDIPARIPCGPEVDARVIELWLNRCRSCETRRGYTSTISRFLGWMNRHNNGISLADVSMPMILEYMDSQFENKKAATKKVHLGAIKSLYSFAQKIGVLRFNPAAAVQAAPDPDNLADKILTEEEVALLVHSAPTKYYRLLLEFVYITGVRVSEAIDAQWTGVVWFREQQICIVGIIGKGNKRRHVRVPLDLMERIQNIQFMQPKRKYLFETSKGKPLTPQAVWYAVRIAAGHAGITKPVSIHWLRHAHASHALHNGARLDLVKQNLGHASLTTTSRYIHAQPNESSSDFIHLKKGSE